jgi:hypothetical protein
MEDVLLPPVVIVAKAVWDVAKVIELATLLPRHGYEKFR